MRLEDHPSVKWYYDQVRQEDPPDRSTRLETDTLRELCLQAGADDVGFVEIDRSGLADQREELLDILPGTRTVVSLVYKLNRESLRSVIHSVANLEFRHMWEHANRTSRSIVRELEGRGVRAVNPPAGFPYEADRWPGKMWCTTDKIVAVEAGLGHMGWNRLVIHPEFGDVIILGTMLVCAELTSYDSPLDYNPCIECKQCVTVCPVGAIAGDGHFDFMSCYTHNYRERLGGFADWIETLVASKSVREYRKRVSDSETISMWQNLSIAGQTRCDRCMAVCPAGKAIIGEFLGDRKGYTERVVKRLRDKQETVYVVQGSDAESYVTSRFPDKAVKRISNGLRPSSTKAFLGSLPIVFQRNQAKGLNATFHFTFTGKEPCEGTAVIRDQSIEVHEGHVGRADLRVTADSRTWIDFLAKEKSLLWALVTRKIRIKGSPRLMNAFARCFPS
jgi:epoxyqueuosine reductase QueG